MDWFLVYWVAIGAFVFMLGYVAGWRGNDNARKRVPRHLADPLTDDAKERSNAFRWGTTKLD